METDYTEMDMEEEFVENDYIPVLQTAFKEYALNGTKDAYGFAQYVIDFLDTEGKKLVKVNSKNKGEKITSFGLTIKDTDNGGLERIVMPTNVSGKRKVQKRIVNLGVALAYLVGNGELHLGNGLSTKHYSKSIAEITGAMLL